MVNLINTDFIRKRWKSNNFKRTLHNPLFFSSTHVWCNVHLFITVFYHLLIIALSSISLANRSRIYFSRPFFMHRMWEADFFITFFDKIWTLYQVDYWIGRDFSMCKLMSTFNWLKIFHPWFEPWNIHWNESHPLLVSPKKWIDFFKT